MKTKTFHSIKEITEYLRKEKGEEKAKEFELFIKRTKLESNLFGLTITLITIFIFFLIFWDYMILYLAGIFMLPTLFYLFKLMKFNKGLKQ